MKSILPKQWVLGLIWMGLCAFQTNAATLTVTLVNAGWIPPIQAFLNYYYPQSNNNVIQSIQMGGSGTSSTVEWDDSALDINQTVVIWASWQSEGCIWHEGTSFSYTQGTGGTATLYVFPGGINTG